MNWIKKFIKPKIKSLFEKRSSKHKRKSLDNCECKNAIYKEDLHLILSVVLNVEPIINYLVKKDLKLFLITKNMN